MVLFPRILTFKFLIDFLKMTMQLKKVQAFPEMPSHFQKCVISAIACNICSTKFVHTVQKSVAHFERGEVGCKSHFKDSLLLSKSNKHLS